LTNAKRALAATYQLNSSWPVKPAMTLITVIRANGVWPDICMDGLDLSSQPANKPTHNQPSNQPSNQPKCKSQDFPGGSLKLSLGVGTA